MGQLVLPAFEDAIVFTVQLPRNLLRKSEDLLGHDGKCSEFSARFAEAGLALRLGLGEFYLVWPRFEGPDDEALAFHSY